MSGTQINNYSQLDSNILEMQLTLDQTRKGMHIVSLTNYDNTSAPQVAAGSVIEVNGGFYKFTANETITGTPTDGTVYITIVPAGATCTAAYTNTAPTWSDEKQGWYGTVAEAGNRYLEYKITKSSTSYSNKRRFTYDDNLDTVTLNTPTLVNPIISGSVYYGVTPVAGFIDNGTPYYIKQLTYSFSASTISATITHNISSAQTNHRIINCEHIRNDNGFEQVNFSPHRGYIFGDTTLYISADSTITETGRLVVWYK